MGPKKKDKKIKKEISKPIEDINPDKSNDQLENSVTDNNLELMNSIKTIQDNIIKSSESNNKLLNDPSLVSVDDDNESSISGEIINNSEDGSDEILSDYEPDLSEYLMDENGNTILDYLSVLNTEITNNTKLMKGVRKDIGRIADCLETFTKKFVDLKVNN
tara:strand:+ start:2175 stop:2657 length:483 start_codon:yes stop_codon:yes gene_type:complete